MTCSQKVCFWPFFSQAPLSLYATGDAHFQVTSTDRIDFVVQSKGIFLTWNEKRTLVREIYFGDQCIETKICNVQHAMLRD